MTGFAVAVPSAMVNTFPDARTPVSHGVGNFTVPPNNRDDWVKLVFRGLSRNSGHSRRKVRLEHLTTEL